MKTFTKTLLISVCAIGLVATTILSVDYMVEKQLTALKEATKIQLVQALDNQKVVYQEAAKKMLDETNKKYADSLKTTLKSAENHFQVYSSTYIQSLIDKVAKIPKESTYEKAMVKSGELYENMMAKQELETYNFGVNHKVVKDVNESTTLEKYQVLEERFKKLGFSQEKINDLIKKEMAKN
jgi:hypothetical protein